MKANELLKKLKKRGATIDPSRGKGGHVRVNFEGRTSYIPRGSKEMKTGTVRAILKQLVALSEENALLSPGEHTDLDPARPGNGARPSCGLAEPTSAHSPAGDNGAFSPPHTTRHR